MKKYLFVLFALFLLFLPGNVKAANSVDLYLFYSSSCMHCHDERQFLNTIRDRYPYLTVHEYEVTENKENDALLQKVKKRLGSETTYVPFTVIGSQRFVGFNDNIANQIVKFIEKYAEEEHTDVVYQVIHNIEPEPGDVPDSSEVDGTKPEQTDDFVVPLLGHVDPKTVSLPVLAVVIGAVDGFNPCAMWILLFLITMLFNMKDRKKMWILGLTFLVSSALVYLLFMVAWLKVAVSFTTVRWIQLVIALIALTGAFVNLRSYWKSIHRDSGCEVVKSGRRKKIIAGIQKITTNKSFFLALVGIIVLAVSVNLIELACSAGLPLLFTQILALNELSSFQYWLYIALYILFFLLDDIAIFVIAMVTFRVTGISTKYTKYSHLIGGMIMALIGILMIVKPEWLMFHF